MPLTTPTIPTPTARTTLLVAALARMLPRLPLARIVMVPSTLRLALPLALRLALPLRLLGIGLPIHSLVLTLVARGLRRLGDRFGAWRFYARRFRSRRFRSRRFRRGFSGTSGIGCSRLRDARSTTTWLTRLGRSI